MEGYKLLQRLGKGAQGSVFLVESKEDKKKYVLKKVECNDENEANKAFKEALALKELRHPYICGYKEFFVTWDKEESAMFVCIVMDYYKLGDLDRALKQKRAKAEAIEEVILKKWFGQMLEAMVFVHKKGMIHRDLKPSNIFMADNLSISIGDFGVATIMGDARTRTRTTVGSMNWMAPEVLERPYDERTDIWSLGCILLEMATCGFMDAAQIGGTLFQIKQSPQVLEDVLETVAKAYSPDLCQVIRTMLRRNFQQRPTAQELVDLPYVQECLKLYGSSLMGLSPATDENTGKGHVFYSLSPDVPKVPKEKGVEAVLAYMKDNKGNPQCQEDALNVLIDFVNKGKSITSGGKKLIAEILKAHAATLKVQIKGCLLLASLATTADEGDVMYTKDLVSPVALAMKSHAGSLDLQVAATQLLMTLSADEVAAEVIGKLGGVQDILAALRAFPNSSAIAGNCCGALWSLSVNEGNAKIVTEEKGLQDVINVFEKHAEQSGVIEAACSALWSLSMEDENIEIMSDNNVISLIVQALETHKKDPKVVKNAAMALASIVEVDEASAYELIRCEDGPAGIDVLLQAYLANKDNEDVVENFSTVVAELGEYDDVRDELRSKKFQDVLSEAKIKFTSNGEVISAVNNALVALGEAKGLKRSGSARSRPRSAAQARK
ncbi:serine/threonine kinase-like domain-containing protein STKLD1 [Rhopilema esculentum]|uniref:serine/threonine kinase-like domain-containing protein STKLD1 n=1 Tax=Rhopilema esculentum TaxID=499914 RepID=UPI0031E390C2